MSRVSWDAWLWLYSESVLMAELNLSPTPSNAEPEVITYYMLTFELQRYLFNHCCTNLHKAVKENYQT